MYHHESEEIYKLLNYDAILFDVDGTLIDSAPGIINTLKEVFAKMAFAVPLNHVAPFALW